MVITLTSETLPARKNLSGGDVAVAAAGTDVQVRVGGVWLLNEEVPAGKSWEVHVSIYAVETTA